jgi:hypothetical protein
VGLGWIGGEVEIGAGGSGDEAEGYYGSIDLTTLGGRSSGVITAAASDLCTRREM